MGRLRAGVWKTSEQGQQGRVSCYLEGGLSPAQVPAGREMRPCWCAQECGSWDGWGEAPQEAAMLALIRLNFVELFGMEVHGHLMTYMTPAHRAHTFQEAWRFREGQDLPRPQEADF